ncbi:MAG: conjugal transfer protein TraG [Bradyrhizobium sp.]|nr:conjugal transfer protein TraG [Bradyrhizobium sp.]
MGKILTLIFPIILWSVLAVSAGHAFAEWVRGLRHTACGDLRGPAVLAVLLAGAALTVLWVRRQWAQAAPIASGAHGTARFSRRRETRRTLGGKDGLIVGRSRKGWLMRYAGPAHLLTIAPTRSGKGVGAIIPNLLTAERSVLCVDPKGENARITAGARAGMGPVFVLDPFEISGEPGAAFNPLSGLDPASVDLAEDAALIADALVHDPPHQVGEAHWNEEAKALIAGLILHVVTTASPALRSLTTVRELLTGPPDQFRTLLTTMQGSFEVGGLVARAANRHLAKSDREAAGVLSAAQRHTHFLDSPRMARVLARSDFAFADLKAGIVSVFLVLPPERLATHSRWLRLLVVQAISALAGAPQGPSTSDRPVLFMLDEFATLGWLEPVERAYGLMAGYGVQLWAFLQDLHQLKGLYGERSGTFLANAGLIQVFNVADVDTATWVSRSMGVSTEAYYTTGHTTGETVSDSGGSSSSGDSTTLNLARRDLMTPDEVMRMDGDRLLLLRPGEHPVMARKVQYYEDGEFEGLAGE